MSAITFYDDTIDSRDIETRLEELTFSDGERDESEDQELMFLTEIRDELKDHPEWEYGLVLISESYFSTYVQEMLEDDGIIPNGMPWYIVVDWEQTADNIKCDYSTIDVKGYEFFYHD